MQPADELQVLLFSEDVDVPKLCRALDVAEDQGYPHWCWWTQAGARVILYLYKQLQRSEHLQGRASSGHYH